MYGVEFVGRANNTKCPCKGCFVRKLGCHGFCEKYQEWKKGNDVKRDSERQWRNASNAALAGLRYITGTKRT